MWTEAGRGEEGRAVPIYGQGKKTEKRAGGGEGEGQEGRAVPRFCRRGTMGLQGKNGALVVAGEADSQQIVIIIREEE